MNCSDVEEGVAAGALALLGGSPAFAEPVVVGRPNPFGSRAVLDRIEAAIERNWLTNHGPLVCELEARVAAMLGVRNCITASNATAGLQVVALALGLRGEVIVPSFTFIAGAHALTVGGIRPVFCDIDPVTHCLDPASVEAAVTPETTGILGVHLWGNACPVPELEAIAARHGLELFFDAAHAFGTRIRGRAVGGFGRAEVFSLHATKIVSAFEGGLITTDDDELAARIRQMTNFGFKGEDTVVSIGLNAKMSEASAAMALTSLDAMPAAVAHNRANLAAYECALAGVPGISVQCSDAEDCHNRQYVVVDVDPVLSGLTRDELVSALRFENIEARRYFHPGCHRQEPYRSSDPDAGAHLPVTERVGDRVMVLPTGCAVSGDDVALISEQIARVVDAAVDVRAALAHGDDPRIPSFARSAVRS